MADFREWLETDGLGGFASGTIAGVRTRRYHGLLVVARQPPAGRCMLVNGLEVWITRGSEKIFLSSQCYAPDCLYPDGHNLISGFSTDPWPKFRYQIEGAGSIEQEILMPHERSMVVLSWQSDTPKVRLFVRPLISGRDLHAIHRANSEFNFESKVSGESIVWQPYAAMPAVRAVSSGKFLHAPEWYYSFQYSEERDRGYDFVEDLASTGIFEFDLDEGPAILIFSSGTSGAPRPVRELHREITKAELKRRSAVPLPERVVENYVVRRQTGKSIIAGYPWFGDWGRDTFISLRGLCLATGRLDEAEEVIKVWGQTIVDGAIPNCFSEDGVPLYNTVDASLWFIIAAYEFIQAHHFKFFTLKRSVRNLISSACSSIVGSYKNGTKFGIVMDSDGLLKCGEKGSQLTWMDARVDGVAVTPRIGKPVEIQALWLNALRILSFLRTPESDFERGLNSFKRKFWNSERNCLYDVIDCDHVEGQRDCQVRPNQIFAIGGLPFQLITGDVALSVLKVVTNNLLTPLGLRTLAPNEANYRGHYQGSPLQRDLAYHQGTVWPWLIGAFVEAWLRVNGSTSQNKAQARKIFLPRLKAHLSENGLNHISEIADGDAPHTARGAPFQAWSIAEYLRLELQVLR